MSILSEITIKLGSSNTYFRLVLVTYLLTIALVCYSSFYFTIKLILIGIICILATLDSLNKMPKNGVKEIQFIGNKWILLLNDGTQQEYQTIQVLIHNELFHLIQFKNSGKKRHVVLFVDQVSEHQLRRLHLSQF